MPHLEAIMQGGEHSRAVKDEGFGLGRRRCFPLPSTICWRLCSLLLHSTPRVLKAIQCFVKAKSKPTENIPKRNSIEENEIVLDPSENW